VSGAALQSHPGRQGKEGEGLLTVRAFFDPKVLGRKTKIDQMIRYFAAFAKKQHNPSWKGEISSRMDVGKCARKQLA
jgi:hypothetical protein